MSQRKLTASDPRLDWPDLCKGAGILLMSLGHSSIPPSWAAAWIYSFHMPLFFFVSGWFFTLRPGGVWATIRHKAFPILMPCLSYSIAKWLWDAASALLGGGAADWNALLGVALQWPDTPWPGYVWFFAGLFVAEAVLALLLKVLGDKDLPLLAACFALAALVWLYAKNGGARLPWHADAALLLLPYLALGRAARRHEEALLRPLAGSGPCLAALLALLAANIALTAVNLRLGPTRIDYNLCYLNEYFTCYAAGTTGAAFCALLCRRLPAFRPLLYLGRNSAVYYAVGWIGSNAAHYAVRTLAAVTGYPLLCVHLLGLCLVPMPLIELLDRLCPALMGKRPGSKPMAETA